ncbi:transposase [Streptomyces bobili]|uniref:transposase n=1 Tax=Streptomyces bobili TaxID=67280 RepID=UPI0036F5C68D
MLGRRCRYQVVLSAWWDANCCPGRGGSDFGPGWTGTKDVGPEPFLPPERRLGAHVQPRRQLLDGIRFRVRTGVPWRDVPVGYGLWARIYDLFRRWQRDGTWHRVLIPLQSLADAKGAIGWDLNVDSTAPKASVPHTRLRT